MRVMVTCTKADVVCLVSSDGNLSRIFVYRSLESLPLSSEAAVLHVPNVVVDSMGFW